MKLTPQQEAVAPALRDHLESRDPRLFVLEGLSSVGKSSLVRHVLSQINRPETAIDEFANPFDVDLPEGHIAVVDYLNPEQIVQLRQTFGEAAAMVVLAHPRFATDRGLLRVNHAEDLTAAGLSSVVHCLNPMSPDETAAFGGRREGLMKEYGLGIRGHVNALLADPLLDEQRATVVTTAKLHQILGHSSRYHDDPIARAEALLGRGISQKLGVELVSTQYGSLESKLAFADGVPDLLPRHLPTLRVYQDILDFRGNDCWGIHVFAPHVEASTLEELGFVEGALQRGVGRFQKIVGGHPSKAWIVTRTKLDGGINDRNRVRRDFDEWMGGKVASYGQLGGLDLPSTGENPVWVHAGTHGGSRKPDTPLFPYAAETLFQARGVPYRAFYFLGKPGNIVTHEVSPQGVSVR